MPDHQRDQRDEKYTAPALINHGERICASVAEIAA